MFCGKRLRQVRELRRLPQSDLAELVGKSQAAIANIEAGFNEPTPELAAAIARQTRFPASFFSTEVTVEFPPECLMFRARASTTRREAVSACRYAEIIYEMAEALEAYVEPIPLRLQKCTQSAAIGAQQARRIMGLLPDVPIPNVINAAEKIGVAVLSLPVDLNDIDAFSAWLETDQKKPVIAVCRGKPGDRLRFSVSHELGHLVLHSDGYRLRTQEHREADQFAAEFLMPEEAMRREIKSPVTVSGVAVLKQRWGVSIQALIRRAYDLNIVTERQYRYLFEQLAGKGWRTREPSNLDIPTEKPRALKKMAELLYGVPPDYARLASTMRLTVGAVKEILDGYAEPTGQENKQSPKVIRLGG